jgi:hemerythrin
MNDLKWDDACLVGIPAVDLQHKHIFDCFVTLGAEAWNGHDRLLATSTYDRLDALLRQNFALEESMMRSFNYPGLERHTEEHRQFHAELHAAARHFLEKSGGVSRDLIRVFRKWQAQHVMTSDMHYLEYFSGPQSIRANDACCVT